MSAVVPKKPFPLHRDQPWPPDSPCYKCGKPVGDPWSDKLFPRRPVCPVCAWENITNAAMKETPWATAK